MDDEARSGLGALRSAMDLTLHTHQAARLWHGRARTADRPGIVGLAGFVRITNIMKHGAEQDDPYSDWWMIRIEDKITETQHGLSRLKAQVDAVLRSVPPALTLGENLNVHPVKVPLFVGSQLGFLAVYLLAAYDELARRTMLAHHVALIERSTYGDWLEEGAHLLRSTFTLAQQYRFSGTTRNDHATNNAAARIAQDKYGQVPQDILEGTRRSRFAPPNHCGWNPSADPSASEPEPQRALEDETHGAEEAAL